MFLIMFSLAPCSVKEVALNSVNIEYTKPANRFLSVVQNINCQLVTNPETATLSNAEAQYKNNDIPALRALFGMVFLSSIKTTQAVKNIHFSSEKSCNYAAKYILYQRLKIGAA